MIVYLHSKSSVLCVGGDVVICEMCFGELIHFKSEKKLLERRWQHMI
jgi:hypothetical protein